MMIAVLAFDLWFENLMVSVRTPFFVHVFETVTFFGEATTVLAFAAILGLFLLFSRTHRLYLAGLVLSLGGATVSAYILKIIIARPRPTDLIPVFTETASSFPSYHSVAAVAFYGFIAFMLCRLYPERKRIVLTLATITILAIGFSRLYLGVHFPTDVLAGYALGTFWLSVGIIITNRFQKT